MEWTDFLQHGPAWTMALGLLATLVKVAAKMGRDHARFLLSVKVILRGQKRLLSKNTALLVSIDGKIGTLGKHSPDVSTPITPGKAVVPDTVAVAVASAIGAG